jgi:hypothetical protein
MKSSFHSHTLASEPTLLNHLQLPTQETPSIILSAVLGLSLYSLGAKPQKTPFPSLSQQYLDCCLLIHFHGNIFTESLSSNEHILWLRYSSFQASCHSIIDAVILQEKIICIWNGQIFHNRFSSFVSAWLFWMVMYCRKHDYYFGHCLSPFEFHQTGSVSIIRCKRGKVPADLCPLGRTHFNFCLIFEKTQDCE